MITKDSVVVQGLCRVPSFWRTYQPTTNTGASSCGWRRSRTAARRGATPAPLAAPADNTSCYSASCSVPDCAKVMLIVNFNKSAIQGICLNVFLFYQTSMLRITDLRREEEVIVIMHLDNFILIPWVIQVVQIKQNVYMTFAQLRLLVPGHFSSDE